MIPPFSISQLYVKITFFVTKVPQKREGVGHHTALVRGAAKAARFNT
jgi:hypothetical protein